MLSSIGVDTKLTMSTECPSAALWPASRPSGAFVGASVYPKAAEALNVEHSQKRFAMAETDIDGWPLGPWNGTSG